MRKDGKKLPQLVVEIEPLPTAEAEAEIHNWRPPCSCGVELREAYAEDDPARGAVERDGDG